MLRRLRLIMILSAMTIVAAAASFSLRAAVKDEVSPLLWGCMLNSEAWVDFPEYGMYGISTNDGSQVELTQSWSMIANAGGFFSNGFFYSINSDKMWGMTFTRMSKFDIDTWEEIYEASTGSDNMVMAATALVYDKIDNVVYGCYHNYDEDGYDFGVGDYSDFSRSTICSLEEPFFGMAVTNEGVLYGIQADGKLFSISKQDGELTEVGSTGLALQPKIQGCVYDPKCASILLAALESDGSTALYAINPSTAEAELVTALANNGYVSVLGLPIQPEPGTPAKISELLVDFPKGSNEGYVRFVIPNKNYSGSNLEGNVDYQILVNGNEMCTGSAFPGSEVNEFLTLETGETRVSVILANEFGQGPKNTVDTYIGFAYPSYASGIKVILDEANKVTITWKQVTSAMGEGYFSEEDVRYNVVRIPDGKVIAEGRADTKCEDTLPEGPWTGYAYEITVINGNVAGAASRSKWVATGNPVELPYVQDFSTLEGFGSFTIVDNPAEDSTTAWSFNPYYGGVIFYPQYTDGDDWLLSPPMEMKEGLIYLLKYSCRANYVYNGSKECIGVAFGEGNDPTTYDVLMEPMDIDWTDAREFKIAISPKEDGVYRIGFHALSKANMRGLVLCGMSVEYGVSPEAPGAPENLVAISGNNGELSSKVTFRLPNTSISGFPLYQISSVDVYRDGKLMTTLTEDLTPGESLTVEDEMVGLTQGMHTYTVMAYNESGCGEAASAECYVGFDAPSSVKNLIFVDNLDGTAMLRWEAPGSVGLNGGYCSPEGIKYQVIVENEFGQMIEEVDYQATEVLISGIPQDGRQRLVVGTVVASNDCGDGEMAMQYAPLYGAPYELPFVETITDGFTTYDCWHSTEMNGSQFSIMMIIGGGSSVEESYFKYSASKSGDHSTLSSGKITLAGAEEPVLSFDYINIPYVDAILSVGIGLPDGEIKEIGKIDFNNVTEPGRDWLPVSYDLKNYTDVPYITLHFTGLMGESGESLCLKRITVKDMYDSAVNTVDGFVQPKVYAAPGVIKVVGAEGMTVDIHNLSGKSIAHSEASDYNAFEVESGVYIVKVGTYSFKVLVR